MAEENYYCLFQDSDSIVGFQLAFSSCFNSPCSRAFFPHLYFAKSTAYRTFRRYAISQARLEITHRPIPLDNNLLPSEANPNNGRKSGVKSMVEE